MSNKGPTFEHYKEVSKKISVDLMTNKAPQHQLNHLQALENYYKTDENLQLSPSESAILSARANQQTQDLLKAHLLDQSFEDKKRLVKHFLGCIRNAITEKKLTPEIVKNTMLDLCRELDEATITKQNAADLSEKALLAKQEVERLEQQQENNELTLSQAKLNAENLQKMASDAATKASECQTRIASVHQGRFKAFVAHTLRQQATLAAITHELQFDKEDELLTTDDIEVACATWEPIIQGKQKRLADVEYAGGRFAGIQSRVTDWNAKMPKALSSEEMAIRDTILPYEPKMETKEIRQSRLSQIAGLTFRTLQIQEQAVVRDKEQVATSKGLTISKQLHELDDRLRAEFEELGIKPIPKNKQSFVGAAFRKIAGADYWNTQFEDLSNSKMPNPPRRVMMEEGAPLEFPERKKLATKRLTPALERHLKIGVKKGYFVGHKSKLTDEYWKAEENDELSSLTRTLEKVRL